MTENIRDSLRRLGNAGVKPQEKRTGKLAWKQHEKAQILIEDIVQ